MLPSACRTAASTKLAAVADYRGVRKMDEEPVLLHEANLMLAILRVADVRSASLEDAAARLRANRAMAGEPPPENPAELWQRLEHALTALERAGAVAMVGDGRFRLTEHGAGLLAAHPGGIDETILRPVGSGSPPDVAIPERAHDDPRPAAYGLGLRAFGDGRPIDANPYASDTPDHLAWENGWSEARDEAKEAEARR
jgi:restriction system protein